MAYIAGAGVGADTPLKKALTQPINSWEDLSKQVNSDLLKYDSMGVKPDANVLANGGLTTNDYNNMVSSLKPQTTPITPTVTTPTTVKDALVSSTPTYAKAPDNSGMINDSYSNLISALKAQIQQRQNDKQLQLNNVGQIYDPQRATSEVRKNSELRSVLEQNINAGDRGGVGRQNTLITQTEGDNRLNAINLQQTNDENSLKNDIANLVLEGNVQEAQLKSQQLKDLVANNYRAEDKAYQQSRDSVSDSQWNSQFEYGKLRDTIGDTRYNTEYKDSRGDVAYNRDRNKVADERYQREYNDKMAQQDFENMFSQNQFNETKTQNEFMRNLQTKGFTADQAQRKWDNAYKTKAFEQSIKDGKLAQSNWQKEMTFKQAQSKIENALSQGRLNNDGAQLALQQAKYNAEQDPNSLDNKYKKAQIDNIQNKGINYDYKSDPDYADDYQSAINSKDGEKILTEKASDFIKKYGLEGYDALLKAVRGE